MPIYTDVNIVLDDTDHKLVSALLIDGRLSYRQLSKRVGVSVATVINRMRRMFTQGVVKGTTCILDYDKLGYEIEAMIMLRISKGKLFEVEKKIATHSAVFSVYDVTGEYDAIVFARFKTRHQLDSFLKKIQTYDFVERTHTSFILNTIKEKQTGV